MARGRVLRLENGRGRREIAETLIAEARRDPAFVVGIDFAFSLPAAFLTKRGHREVDDVWREVEAEGESWLAECPFPFWGKPGKRKPALSRVLYRRTEVDLAAATGLRPFSVFQIGGVGAVGVGSVRGMPILRRLRDEGFAVWPFDPPEPPLLLEIWPRVFIGRVRKTDRRSRRRFVDQHYPNLAAAHAEAAEASDDAFDALVSALEMERRRMEIEMLAPAPSATERLEGQIWRPAVS